MWVKPTKPEVKRGYWGEQRLRAAWSAGETAEGSRDGGETR